MFGIKIVCPNGLISTRLMGDSPSEAEIEKESAREYARVYLPDVYVKHWNEIQSWDDLRRFANA